MLLLLAYIESKYIKEEGKMPEMFELHNNATIGELKQKLEVKVGLPLARLNVQSFHKSLEDEEFITSLLRIPDNSDFNYPSTTLNGTAFSLYHENSFVGFLQFYTIPEGKSQLDFLNMPKSSVLLPVDRLPHFCEVSNSQDSSASSASNQTNCSFESTSSSASSGARKTKMCSSDEESAVKRIRSNQENSVVKVVPQQNLLADKRTGSMASIFGSQVNMMPCYKTETSRTSSSVEQAEECKTKKKDCCMPKNCRKRDTRPPYANTMPENRRYSLVITNQSSCSDGVDTVALMEHFHSLFEDSGSSVSDLNFSECASTQKFDCNMLVVCEDNETAQWVISAVEGVDPPHSCQPFIKFFGLLRTTFVLPLVSPSKSLCVIFALLESQNPGLNTDKWAVVNRSTVDGQDVDRQVAEFCDNVLIEVYIDEESRDFIVDRCSKLRYCFWQLRFYFM
ncbi:uncharacterized protein LOC117143792 isoform X1 [Drosophila mauritiana]|uniref:Uncharacterized protein LOC117143792 isoform X1 n=1 Tax=Drosophila mauritiana TaxID=7226 RepID=A0A6P8KKA7_DROMA|nr:uncharacterized protein LOC117143792 isoform X1 [Drosophila mauritiana]